MKLTASINLDVNKRISAIDPRIYGSFIEHMGRAIYTGIFEPGHESADASGIRQDVVELIRPMSIPVIRYPGGNFVSGYRWEDGIGPKETRPVRPELAWFALETNQFGTNEFMDFLEQINAGAMMSVNLGTRGAQDAVNLLEYCNFSGGTYYSDLRKSHGYDNPHDIKLWCLGNEMDGPWQICAKTAEEYGRVACETAKMMKWLDPSIELVACGSSFREMPTFGEWERTVLRHTYEHIDYLSLHNYYTNNENNIASFLASNIRMGHFINEVADICKDIKAEKKTDKDIYLSFDEWNVWYHYKKHGVEPPKWISARPIEEEAFDFADALLIGSMLITLINHSDIVKIACLAQLVNTIAPIMTEPDGIAWVHSIYYPFLLTSQFGRGIALDIELNSPTYDCNDIKQIPYIDCAAVLSEDSTEISLFLVNKHLSDDIECHLTFHGFNFENSYEGSCLSGFEFSDTNTPEAQMIIPNKYQDEFKDMGSPTLNIPKASWSLIRLKKRETISPNKV